MSAAGLPTLVILADTPTFGWRPKEIRNGLSIPPKMTLRNIMQMTTCPSWSLGQLLARDTRFQDYETLHPQGPSMKHLGLFMNKTFSGRLTADKISAIRDRWKGKLVVKGIVNPEDAEKAIKLGVDGMIVSNHGGRQLDVGQSTIKPLTALAEEFGSKTTLMIDSGVRNGPGVACSIASGAKFAFMGRTFMYGVGALGAKGGDHTMTMLSFNSSKSWNKSPANGSAISQNIWSKALNLRRKAKIERSPRNQECRNAWHCHGLRKGDGRGERSPRLAFLWAEDPSCPPSFTVRSQNNPLST